MMTLPVLRFAVPFILALSIGATDLLQAQARPAVTTTRAAAADDTKPPVAKDSVKFLVIGDSGTGDRAESEVAAQTWKSHEVFPYEFAIMLGDNMYGSERPQDFASKFELPYKAHLDANIPFYAALGNHDDPNQRYYKPFGMGGQRFYSYQKKDVKFYVLDSNYLDKDQQAWLEKELSGSNAKWKIAYFHHPLYSTGGRHGSEVDLRTIVEPMFIKYGMNAVFSGHEHFYERLKPQKGINYFTEGGAAKLAVGDVRGGAISAKGYDAEQTFMLVEIEGDVLHFQTLTRRGKLVDSGDIRRRPEKSTDNHQQ